VLQKLVEHNVLTSPLSKMLLMDDKEFRYNFVKIDPYYDLFLHYKRITKLSLVYYFMLKDRKSSSELKDFAAIIAFDELTRPSQDTSPTYFIDLGIRKMIEEDISLEAAKKLLPKLDLSLNTFSFGTEAKHPFSATEFAQHLDIFYVEEFYSWIESWRENTGAPTRKGKFP